MISGTKGAHLILDNDELYKQFADGQVFYETPDGRVPQASRAMLERALLGLVLGMQRLLLGVGSLVLER